ncbi:LAFA_0F21484g1_1 [Lachancea sp. 'fantastica']|nr:LAFA_0F21484g1_1 [Lachancea sp. 'fantastica']
MSVVQIAYNFSSYREKVEPGKNLNDVLPRSLEHFKLSTENRSWALYHNGKHLPLTIPLRLLNLATGATLELKELNNLRELDQNLKLKFTVLGHGAEVWTGPSSTKILDAIQEIFERKSWPLISGDMKLQCFSKVYDRNQIGQSTFSELGILENVAIRLSFASIIEKPKKQSDHLETITPPPMEKKEHVEDTVAHSPPTTGNDQSIAAYIPDPNVSLASYDNQEDEELEVTVNHFKKYQKMLSKTTGSDQPLLTKRLREKENPIKKIDNCNVRVRLPDRTCVDINFKPDDTIRLVYEAVTRCLDDRTAPFALFHSHPHQEIPNNDSKLTEDLHFGSKTLLVLESGNKDLKLRSDLIEKAKTLASLRDTDDNVKQTLSSPLPKTYEKKTGLGLRSGQTPKWLKLGKK